MVAGISAGETKEVESKKECTTLMVAVGEDIAVSSKPHEN
jgi:hypothetical protein